MVRNFRAATRGLTPLLGSALLVGIVVVLAGVVGATALDMAASTPAQSQPVALSLQLSEQSLALTHEAGPSLDVRTLRVLILVDGTPLSYQPPIPFFSAKGFAPGPTGPFNTAADPTWTVGETARLELAGTNSPSLRSGSEVVVRVFRGETQLAHLRGTVG